MGRGTQGDTQHHRDEGSTSSLLYKAADTPLFPLQACSAVTGSSAVVHSTAEELSTRFTTGDIDNMTGNEAVKLLKRI